LGFASIGAALEQLGASVRQTTQPKVKEFSDTA
jgi:hypothetical protein